MKEINFTNPLNGRKWLQLLKPHKEFGITFRKNLNIKKSVLGFSFKTNKFGLRGLANEYADTVILGTSYAMGLSVDNSKNWFELSSNIYQNTFNASMPVGFDNLNSIIDKYHLGEKKSLIYLYHPNQFLLGIDYSKAYKKDKTIFEFNNWKTDRYSVIKLYVKWQIKKLFLNKELSFKMNNIQYYLNKNYCYLDFDKNKKLIDDEIKKSLNIFNKFDNVTIYKIPIKEEIIQNSHNLEQLKILKNNNDERWNYFKKYLSNFKIIDLSNEFELSDYLPQDTHWSESGNKKFSALVDSVILPKINTQ
jgi:hypothetical protein